jgi:hypothetical protein
VRIPIRAKTPEAGRVRGRKDLMFQINL